MMGSILQKFVYECDKWVASCGHWDVSRWCARRL